MVDLRKYVWVVRLNGSRATLCTDGAFRKHNKPAGVVPLELKQIDRPTAHVLSSYIKGGKEFNPFNMTVLKVTEHDWVNPRTNKIHHGLKRTLIPKLRELVEL